MKLPRSRLIVLALALAFACALGPSAQADAHSVDHFQRRHESHLNPRLVFGGGSSNDDDSSSSSDDAGSTSADSSTKGGSGASTTDGASSSSSASSAQPTSSKDSGASTTGAAGASSASLSSIQQAASSSAAAAASSSAQAAQSSTDDSKSSTKAATTAKASNNAASTTALQTSTDAAGQTVIVTSIVQASATDSSTAAASSTSSDSDDSSSNHTPLIIGVSVVGGVAVIAGIIFVVMKFTGKRAGFDDGDADIKWPELKHNDGDAAAMQPLPARRTGGAGFDMGDDGSDNGHMVGTGGSVVAGMGGYGADAGDVHSLNDAAAAGYGPKLSHRDSFNASSTHLTGAGAYGMGAGQDYANFPPPSHPPSMGGGAPNYYDPYGQPAGGYMDHLQPYSDHVETLGGAGSPVGNVDLGHTNSMSSAGAGVPPQGSPMMEPQTYSGYGAHGGHPQQQAQNPF